MHARKVEYRIEDRFPSQRSGRVDVRPAQLLQNRCIPPVTAVDRHRRWIRPLVGNLAPESSRFDFPAPGDWRTICVPT